MAAKKPVAKASAKNVTKNLTVSKKAANKVKGGMAGPPTER